MFAKLLIQNDMLGVGVGGGWLLAPGCWLLAKGQRPRAKSDLSPLGCWLLAKGQRPRAKSDLSQHDHFGIQVGVTSAGDSRC